MGVCRRDLQFRNTAGRVYAGYFDRHQQPGEREPAFYVNAPLQYQKGDELTVREDGLAFGYNEIDETKRIISQVSYSESSSDVNLDNKLILKVAQGEKDICLPVAGDDLVLITSYLNKIKFAGTRIEVTSSKATF